LQQEWKSGIAEGLISLVAAKWLENIKAGDSGVHKCGLQRLWIAAVAKTKGRICGVAPGVERRRGGIATGVNMRGYGRDGLAKLQQEWTGRLQQGWKGEGFLQKVDRRGSSNTLERQHVGKATGWKGNTSERQHVERATCWKGNTL
jgi:hypothetical protein